MLKLLALDHDVVFNFAVAFGSDEASVQALVDGLEERARKTGSKPVLMHAGGSGTIMYGSGGKAGADVWTVSYTIDLCVRTTLTAFRRTSNMTAGHLSPVTPFSMRVTRCESYTIHFDKTRF
jgi:hypothetical protein